MRRVFPYTIIIEAHGKHKTAGRNPGAKTGCERGRKKAKKNFFKIFRFAAKNAGFDKPNRDLYNETAHTFFEKEGTEMTLETPRLRLRPWKDSDAEQLYLLARDPRVGPVAGWPPHKDLQDSRRILKDILQTEESYAVVRKETGEVIGSIGLRRNSDLASGDNERELGYWLGVPFWGKGYMPEAAKEVLRHAFEDLLLDVVWCGYYEGNAQSKRVQEKLGFTFQWKTERLFVAQMNEYRTGYVNRMTRDEWVATRDQGPGTRD